MDIYEQIVELRRWGRRGAVATIVNVRGSIPSFKTAKMLVRDDGSIVGTIGGGCVEADVWQAAREVMESEKPRTLKFDLNQDPKYDTGLVCGGTLEVFVEPVLPPALLYVFGAGHVAFNLCQTAANAGFDVTVTDDRSSYATKERFPAAREVYALDFEEATIEIFKNLQKEGVPAPLFDRVHAPVGLDIGAITPEEIAVAITAELIAIRRHASAALPHLSWFKGAREKPGAESSAEVVEDGDRDL